MRTIYGPHCFDITKKRNVVGWGYNVKEATVLTVHVLLNSFYLETYEGEGISNDSSFGPATYR